MVIRLLYVYDMMRFVLCRKPVHVYETILYNTYTNTAKIRLEKEIENEKKIPVAPDKCSSSACIPVAPGTVTGATGISSSGRQVGALLLLLCSSSGCLRALLLQVSCSALAVAGGGALLIGHKGALLIAFLLVV